MYRGIYNQLRKRTGVIVLNLDHDYLQQKLQNYLDYPGQELEIYTSEGDLLLHTSKEGAKQGKNTTYLCEDNQYNFTFRLTTPNNQLTKLLGSIVLITMLLLLVTAAIGIFLTKASIASEYAFFTALIRLLDDAKAGLPQKKVTTNKMVYNSMIQEIVQNFLEKDFLQVQKEAMEYRALQGQINPHFLCNTLETINWKAVKLCNGTNEISSMINLLSNILRYVMEFDTDKGVPLTEEITFTKYFLEIQNIRFPDQFSVTWDIPEAILPFHVPKLILQPILENAFTHGLANSEKFLEISITFQLINDRLTITVADNGEGSDEETIQKINSASMSAISQSAHLGLANLCQRIHIAGDSKARVEIRNRETGGLILTIRDLRDMREIQELRNKPLA